MLRASIFTAVLLLSTLANGQGTLFRAYLATDGSDANPCTLSSPCRLLPAALAAVVSGGEIWLLDSANYNTATVNVVKSVSILAIPGAVGSVVSVGGPAISVTAVDAAVALRNLVIVPLPGGAGTNGISLTGAGTTVFVDNTLISGVSGYGIEVNGTGRIQVTNCMFRNFNNTAIYLRDGATADVASSQFLSTYAGVVAVSSIDSVTTTASVTDSVFAKNYQAVFLNNNATGALTRIFVTRSSIHNAEYALTAFGSLGVGTIAISSTMVVNNTYAWLISGAGATVRTFGNNPMSDNSTAVGSLTPTSPL